MVVDGHVHKIDTAASSVRGALAGAGYHVDKHDLVAPAPNSSIHDGTTIVFKRGRLLRLTVDGTPTQVWTTAPTVAAALSQLGYPSSDFVSVSRSTRLPLTPTSIALRSPKNVQVKVANRTQSAFSTAPTVGALLHELNIKLGPHDRVHPTLSTPVTQLLQVRIDRVHIKRVTKREVLDFRTVDRDTSGLYKGQSRLVRAGREGHELVTYKIVIVNGKRVRRAVVHRQVLAQPVSKIERIGTKQRPAPSPPPVSGGEGLNWDAVANCESGGDWSIDTGNGFYGGLQFTYSTWLAYGGGQYASSANLASPSEQIAVATRLYNAEGSSPWPVCGQYL
jgi:uncharacterized protein YabE (DUF348 family)